MFTDLTAANPLICRAAIARLSLLMALLVPPSAFANTGNPVTVGVVEVDGPFHRDGRLDEAFWKAAPVQSGLTRVGQPPGSSSSNQQTTFQLVLHEGNLLVGVRCQQPEADLLVRTRERGNASVCADDFVEIFLSPASDGFYQLAVNAEGYLFDRWVVKGGERQPPWNGAWEAVVWRGREEWSVELVIPLATLNRHRSSSSGRWRINLARNWAADRRYESWAPVETSYAEVDRHRWLRFPESTPPPPTALIAEDSLSGVARWPKPFSGANRCAASNFL